MVEAGPRLRESLRCPHCGYWLDLPPRGTLSGIVLGIVELVRGRRPPENYWCWRCMRTIPAAEAVSKMIEVREWEDDD